MADAERFMVVAFTEQWFEGQLLAVIGKIAGQKIIHKNIPLHGKRWS